MPKGDKYIGLSRYLNECGKKVLIMTFDEIESIIGDKLPSSAHKHNAFWANTKTHSVAFGWLNAGYRTVDVDKHIDKKEMLFEKF
jgi:hypothetical protein